MGCCSSKNDLTDENSIQCAFDVLQFTGLPLDDFNVKNIVVDERNGKEVCIRTIICGDEQKPKLVFIHGFGASGPAYYKIIKSLSDHFCLVFHDLIGMGGSSRPADYNISK